MLSVVEGGPVVLLKDKKKKEGTHGEHAKVAEARQTPPPVQMAE